MLRSTIKSGTVPPAAAPAAPAGFKIPDYKNASEMTDFKLLFEPATKSLVAKNLTEAIWNEYKD